MILSFAEGNSLLSFNEIKYTPLYVENIRVVSYIQCAVFPCLIERTQRWGTGAQFARARLINVL